MQYIPVDLPASFDDEPGVYNHKISLLRNEIISSVPSHEVKRFPHHGLNRICNTFTGYNYVIFLGMHTDGRFLFKIGCGRGAEVRRIEKFVSNLGAYPRYIWINRGIILSYKEMHKQIGQEKTYYFSKFENKWIKFIEKFFPEMKPTDDELRDMFGENFFSTLSTEVGPSEMFFVDRRKVNNLYWKSYYYIPDQFAIDMVQKIEDFVDTRYKQCARVNQQSNQRHEDLRGSDT